MNIKEIRQMPTCVSRNHESILQAYHILEKVTEMLERGDSRETILELVKYLKEKNGDKP